MLDALAQVYAISFVNWYIPLLLLLLLCKADTVVLGTGQLRDSVIGSETSTLNDFAHDMTTRYKRGALLHTIPASVISQLAILVSRDVVRCPLFANGIYSAMFCPREP
jgi:hypothetical protein